MKRSRVKFCKFCSVCLLAASLTGCGRQTADLSSAPAASVPTNQQTQVEQIAQTYIKTIQAKDFVKAEALMSPAYQAAMPAGKLKAGMAGPYKPLAAATAFRFDPAQLSPNGAQIVLRAQFQGSDKKLYRTNFLFSQTASAWRISKLVPPASRPHPFGAHEKSS